jgi:O-methyltransferase
MFDLKLPTLLSHNRLHNLAMYSRKAAAEHPQAAICEFGVFKGGSLELLAKVNPDRDIFGIDSFEGLPPTDSDETHLEGDFNETDVIAIRGYFKMVHPNVKILKGFSPGVFGYFAEGQKFSFVHVDVDVRSSAKDAMEFFYPRLVEGGIMLWDDYGFNSTPTIKPFLDSYRQLPEFGYADDLKYATGESHNQFIIIK